MKNTRQTSASTESDPLVSKAYTSSATEVVPAHLDRTVLHEARRAIGSGTFTPRFPGWISPAVFAATVVLSLTFYLEYDGVRNSSDSVGYSSGMRDGSSVIPPEAANELATAIKSTGRKLRALDSTTESLQSGNKPAVSPSDTATTIAPPVNAPSAKRFCRGEMSASEESWRSCIDGLQGDGFAEAARLELELLKTAYPESGPALQ